MTVGAAAGGLFAGLFGIQAAFIVDAATYALSAVLLVRMPYTAPEAFRRSRRPSRPAWRRPCAPAPARMPTGCATCGGSSACWPVALQKGFLLFFFSGFQVASVAIAGTAIAVGQGDGIALGLLFAAGGVSSGLRPGGGSLAGR